MQIFSLDNIPGIVPIISGEALIIRNASDLRPVMAMLSHRCTVTVYATQGSAQWMSENETTTITKGDLLIHKVTSTKCELIPEKDFGMFAVCVSNEYNRQFSQMVKISWKVRQALITNALFHLSAEDRIQISENQSFLLMKCNGPEYPQRTLILKHLLHILSVDILLRLERYIVDNSNTGLTQDQPTPKNVSVGNYTSAQVIYNRFSNMLEKTAVKNRPVVWWAKQLNISPKYLSAICRQVEGKSARNLIANSVIQEATSLLQSPELSVKEISQRLGFVNQSHFGTFYKRHTGHSPIRGEE